VFLGLVEGLVVVVGVESGFEEGCVVTGVEVFSSLS
jgi:hypothetical protein